MHFIRSIGSLLSAALLKYIGKQLHMVPMISNIDTCVIHLIGKLIRVRLKLPLRICLPADLISSVPALLSFD